MDIQILADLKLVDILLLLKMLPHTVNVEVNVENVSLLKNEEKTKVENLVEEKLKNADVDVNIVVLIKEVLAV